MPFQWDNEKDITNQAIHEGVTFEEAATVFGDPLREDFADPDHSGEEDRFITVGYSSRNRLLLVSYTERDRDVRIISARKADKQEQKDYANGNSGDRF